MAVRFILIYNMSLFDRAIQHNMELIKIKDHEQVYSLYSVSDPYLMKFLNDRHQNKKPVHAAGGKNPNRIEYVFEGYTFIIFELKVEDGYDIAIRRSNDPESAQTCLHIMINSRDGLAYVKNISYYPECIKVGLEHPAELKHPGGGSVLLKLCLQFLKQNKAKYKIRRIQLLDNSFVRCDANKKNISLSLMHTLMLGNTWYGKYGFRPYDPYLDIEDAEDAEMYDLNHKIVKRTIVKNTNLFNYLYKVIRTQKSKTDAKAIVDKYYDLYKDYTIGQFFRMFLAKYDDSCSMLSAFYKRYAFNQNIWNPHNSSFYLDI